MKLISFDHPVKRSWLADQGLRLDASPYLSGSFEAKKVLEDLPVCKDKLADLTIGHNGGIFNGPKFSRLYLQDPERAVRFLGSTDMMEADLSYLPLLANSVAEKLPYLQIEPAMTLISCSGTIGRMTYVRHDMADIWSSQHVMKIQPDAGKIPPGYLNTFLRSRFGVPIITSQAYGAIIQHIEPHHIADLPVPRFDPALEQEIHGLVQVAADLRADFQRGVVAATKDLFTTAGLPDLLDLRWHEQERDLGFVKQGLNAMSLRALNFQPRARKIIDRLAEVDHIPLGEICAGGQLSRGVRFLRVDGPEDSEFSYRLIGQRQAFWLRPEGRWVTKSKTSSEVLAKDETILVASQGTLGENEVFCRPILATGSWLDSAYSEHFLRIISGSSEFSGAYLFALFRSEAMFRVLRSMSTGGKQQDIHEALRAQIPIPILTPEDRNRIAETIREAYRNRDNADLKEDQALALLESAVLESAGVTDKGVGV